MKVTKLDNGALHVDVPEVLSVSSAMAEGRDVGSPLGFQIQHDDAVRLALLIVTIPAPDTMDPHVAVPRDLLEELVHAAGHGLDILSGTEAIRLEKTLVDAKALLPADDWLGVRGVEVGAGYSLDRLMQAQYNARAQRKIDISDEEWESVKLHPAHRSSLRILRDELLKRAEDGEFDS